jgi:hypothetical protein
LSREFTRDTLLTSWYDPANKREQHRQECSLYSWVDSFPGSWVIHYWAFYPFDTGATSGHFNDTEHLFVEVDKLGGEPVGVFVNDHIFINPNNLYSSLEADTGSRREPRPTLPLFALVEEGKHGMAPDINRDGMFTPGVDTNMHTESSQVWGIRDSIGHGDTHITGYESSMTARRLREDTLAPTAWQEFFPDATMGEYNDLKYFCSIVDWHRVSKPAGGVAPYSVDGAIAEILRHPDAGPLRADSPTESSTRILKSWAYPYYSVRLGAGKYWPDFQPDLYLALALDLVRLTSRVPGIQKAPLPGKIAIEGMWSPGSQFAGRPSTVGHVWQVGGTYERTLTTLFGIFVGVHERLDRLYFYLPPGSSLPSSSWQRSTWWSAGAMAAVPTPTGAIIVHAGPATDTQGTQVQFRLDVSWEPLHWRGRKRFGISQNGPSYPP